MGGKPCIRGMRVTVGMIVGMLAEGHSSAEILKLYPYSKLPYLPCIAFFSWLTRLAATLSSPR